MPDYRPISRSAHCGNDHWRGSIEVVDGANRNVYDNVEIDLNAYDEGANPRVQLADGLWVDVNTDFVRAFRNLIAPLENASTADCSETLPAPRYPVRLTGVVDMTMGTNLISPGRTHPGFASSFYSSDTFFNPNGEAILDVRPAPGLALTLDLSVGANAIITQPFGLQHGYPVDVPQLFIDYCPAGGLFCMGAGRRGDRSGAEGYRSDGDWILRSMNYSISPFTQLVGELGLRGSNAYLNAAVGPGPDQFLNNNGMPYLMFNAGLSYPSFAVAVNYQTGADQPGNNDRWRHFWDLGLTFGPNGPVRGILYGMVGTETSETGQETWGGANGYLRIRPEGSPVQVDLRGGYTHMTPLRSGLPETFDALQASGGLRVYAAESISFRAQADVLGALGGSRPFNGESLLPRFMFQLVYSDTTDFGVAPLPR